MRWLALALAVAGCGTSGAFPGDALCAEDGGCPTGQACSHVVDVLASDGKCMPSTGANVCRAVCTQCPAVIVACGCVCPP
jgi:hypothetical protein